MGANMGIFDFLSGEFIDVIHWVDDSRDTMVWRFEREDHEIKYGAKLTVREGQAAVFVHEGQLADVFTPGLYMLETNNMPIMTTLQHWDHGFKSPFKSEIYFVNTTRFNGLKWGTKNPVICRDPEFGPVRLRAFGTYSVKVADPAKFLVEIVGTDGEFRVPQVPAGINAYGAVVTVQARSTTGELVSSSFGVSVHRPLEVFYNGNVEVAEVMNPTPVSGCIPGGFNGRDVQYTESESQTLAKNYAVSWNESWLQSHTVQQGSSQTIGLSERNGVGFATTNGQSFDWSLGAEVNGRASLFDLVELGVKQTAQTGGAVNQSNTNSASRETGVNASTTTTETESVSASNSQSQSQAFAWQVSSTEVISQGFGGFIIPNTYGAFYRQTTRLVRRAAMVAYNQCGAAQVVGEIDFTDWTWSPDLALAAQCPPLPPSNLPGAQCNVPPCSGQ